ncbi:hypothetical protein IID19_01645 [Patescibacteria group bacterium]|nr:hypothetical protein [Patescibacteria group bacterium]
MKEGNDPSLVESLGTPKHRVFFDSMFTGIITHAWKKAFHILRIDRIINPAVDISAK